MSDGGGTTTTVQNTDPWKPAQPFLKNILSESQRVYQQGSDYYPFSTVVPFTQQTEQGLQGIEDRANAGNPLAGMTQQSLGDLLGGTGAYQNLTDTAGGNFLNSNPYFDELISSVVGDTQNAVNSQFSTSGLTGSPAHAGVMTDEIGKLISGLRYQNYNQERQNQLGAASTLGGLNLSGIAAAPGVYDFGFSDLSKLIDVGAARESKASQTLQDLQDRWKFSQEAPWTNLSRWANLINPVGGQGGTSTTTAPDNSPSGLQQGIGTALAIASLF